jgi:hypothetical protein
MYKRRSGVAVPAAAVDINHVQMLRLLGSSVERDVVEVGVRPQWAAAASTLRHPFLAERLRIARCSVHR